MVIVFYILLGMTALACIYWGYEHLMLRHQRSLTAKQSAISSSAFSWPARQVLESLDRLPAENRPGMDFKATLKALDAKYDLDEVNDHFSMFNYNYEKEGTWICTCRADKDMSYLRRYLDYDAPEFCPMYPEYGQMHTALQEVAEELSAREQAIREHERHMMIAGLSSDLDAAEDILVALRNERQAIAAVTSEIRKELN